MAETAHSGFGHVEQPTDGYLDRVGVAGIGRSKCVSQIVLVRDRVHDELRIHRRRNVGQNDRRIRPRSIPMRQPVATATHPDVDPLGLASRDPW